MYPDRVLSGMTGAELRTLRAMAGWSQAGLAERLGIHKNTVARYERGELVIPEPVARLTALLVERAAVPKRRAARRRDPVER